MKKFLLLILCLTLSLVSTAATSGTCGDNLTWSLEDGVLTISGTGAMTNYSSLSDVPWYSSHSTITQIVISEGVTSIGNYAFYNCSSLTSITIPNSVTRIGGDAFSFCSGLTSITIPNSVTSIGERTFRYCSGLTSVTIPNSVTSIGDNAFSYSGLTSVTIPNSVTSIGDRAFYECSGLTTVNVSCKDMEDFGNYVRRTDIGSVFYSYSSGLSDKLRNIYIAGELQTNITIPNSVTSIGSGAFESCSGLTSITIPNSVTSIGSGAFESCSGLTSITIPNSVTSIGKWAFSGCSGLTSVTIPNSVTSIGNDAFYSCSGLTTVNVSCKDMEDFGNYVRRTDIGSVFYSYSSELSDKLHNIYIAGELQTNITIPNSVTSIGDYAFYGCSGLTFTIPNSVTSIGGSAFEGCSGLTSITIPNSVTSIGELAFYGCSGLTSVNITDLTNWCNIDFGGYGANPTYYAHKLVLNGIEIKDLVIPEGVTAIKNYAFCDCSGLTSVTIPNSVTSIGDRAFYECSGLTTVNVSCKDMEDFSNYVRRTDIVSVFYSSGLSGKLHNIYIAGELQTDITIPNSVTSIGDEAFRDCSGLTSITIPNSVTSIGDYAFRGCSGLTSIIIPNSVTSIGNNAFYGCSNVKELIYAEGSSEILRTGLTSIVSVIIPNSVETIPSECFRNCSALKKVVIGKGVREIKDLAFAGADRIEEIYALPVIPPTCASSNVFDGYVYKAAIVYVPNERNSITRYRAESVWKDFFEIVENVPTGITGVNYFLTPAERNYYNLQGQRKANTGKGLNIVDGKKVLMR